jgi:hypothetical protein
MAGSRSPTTARSSCCAAVAGRFLEERSRACVKWIFSSAAAGDHPGHQRIAAYGVTVEQLGPARLVTDK